MRIKADFSARTAILVGGDGLAALRKAKVSVYGLGGVGAACAMDLVRAGVGRIRVVDFDKVEASNLNRLCIGYGSTIGEAKVAAFSRLAREINPEVEVEGVEAFFSGEDAGGFVDAGSGWHADCVDSLNPKVNLIAALRSQDFIFISSMGTAGRLAPERLKLGNFRQSAGCPLARSVRIRLHRRGVPCDFPAVWSDEPPVKPIAPPLEPTETGGDSSSAAADRPMGRARLRQGSAPFVPQVAGHFLASWIVRAILAAAHPGSGLDASETPDAPDHIS